MNERKRERGTIDLIIEMPRCVPPGALTVMKPSRAAGVTVEVNMVPVAEERDERTNERTEEETRRVTEGCVDTRREIMEEGEVHVQTGGADNKA